MGTPHVRNFYYLYRMDSSLHAESISSGVSGNTGLSVGDTLGLLQEWLDKYAQTFQDEKDIERKYRSLMFEAATRRQEYAEAIIKALGGTSVEPPTSNAPPVTTGVSPAAPNEPPLAAGPKQFQESPAHSETESSRGQSNDADKPDGASMIELVESQFTKRGSLKKAVLAIFKREDTFLSTDDVLSHLKVKFPSEKFENKHIVDSIRDGRRTKQLAGHRLYIGQTTRYTYLNGLSSFFSNVSDNSDAKMDEVKSEYQDKLLQRMIDIEMAEKAETARSEQSKNSVAAATLFAADALK